MYELKFILSVKKPRHLLLHEPDEKCVGYEVLLAEKGYTLIETGRDKIGNHNPLWVHYER
jgi:hypothetical protein